MKVLARNVRKGQLVNIYGVTVKVTKREKWNSGTVKIHFEDCGNGVPLGYQSTGNISAYLPLNKELEVM